MPWKTTTQKFCLFPSLDCDKRMIEYLSHQLYMQRGRVSGLKASLQEKEEIVEQAKRHAYLAEISLKTNQYKTSRSSENSTRLENKLTMAKASTVSAKSTLESIQKTHAIEIAKQKMEYTSKQTLCQNEVELLTKELRATKTDHAAEILRFKHKLHVSEEQHHTEMEKIQENLRKVEDSYTSDMTKMLDALENAGVDSSQKELEEEVEKLRERIENLALARHVEKRVLLESLCKKCKVLYEEHLDISGRSTRLRLGGFHRSMGSKEISTEV